MHKQHKLISAQIDRAPLDRVSRRAAAGLLHRLSILVTKNDSGTLKSMEEGWKVGPAKESVLCLRGIAKKLHLEKEFYVAWFNVGPNKDKVKLGCFSTIKDAVLKRDCEILRAALSLRSDWQQFLSEETTGVFLNSIMNDSYTIKSVAADSSAQQKDATSEAAKQVDLHIFDGTVVRLDIPPTGQYCPRLLPSMLMVGETTVSESGCSIVQTPQIQSDYLQQAQSYRRSWSERTAAASATSSVFAFDMTFSHTNPLGLNLRQHLLGYSSGGVGVKSRRRVGCLVVTDVSSQVLEPYVHSGDLIIRVNDVPLVSVTTPLTFEQATRLIMAAPHPRTLRFLRASANGILPSPAEVLLLIPEHTVTARFNVTASVNGTTTVVHPLAIDAAAPLPIRKMMAGQAVSWEAPIPDRKSVV